MKETFNKYSGLIIFALIVLLALAWCSRKPIVVKESSVYDKLKKDVKKLGEFKALVLKKDSIVYRDRHHWHETVKEVNKAPQSVKQNNCDSLLNLLETAGNNVIKSDSNAIQARDSVIAQQVKIDKDKDAIIDQKNDTIRILKKEIRKQTWQKRGVIALWVLREGVGIANKVKP